MTALAPLDLGPMPVSRTMRTVDELLVRAPLRTILALSADVERWPSLLPHYRFVRFQERRSDDGGIVDMSAYRPFGIIQWPTWWRSRMSVHQPGGATPPAVRYTHIAGITKGMEVEWTFEERGDGTFVRIVHLWDGPPIPGIGEFAATAVIGPVFVHGIASRTLAGLGAAAERHAIGAGN